MPYYCGACRKYFSVRTGTPIEASNLGLQKWAIAFYLLSTNLKGASSMKLHRDIEVTQKTAWHLAHKGRLDEVFQAIPSIREIAEMLTPSTLRAMTPSKVALRCWRR